MAARTSSLVFVALALGATPALASGPVYVNRHELPPAIARLHTCVPPRGETSMLPQPWRVAGVGAIFVIACPPRAPNVTSFAVRPFEPVPNEPVGHDAFYLARDAKGTGAIRLKFPVPRADRSTLTADALPTLPNLGWSTRANTSIIHGIAYLDLTRSNPPGAFHLQAAFRPADRPEIEAMTLIWRGGRDGKLSLIYWAETTEKQIGEPPNAKYPRYDVKLDLRPDR
jgi:hypothetical protein